MKCFMSEKECDCKVKQKPLQVFVISPFGYPFDDIYEKGIKNILHNIDSPELPGAQLIGVRADQSPQLGFVMCQKICQQIQESEFIIADISKPNPNVYYELGLSYGMNKKIILIGQKEYGDALTFGITENKDSYIRYQSLNDFENRNLFSRAFQIPVRNSTKIPGMPGLTILNIVNENTTIQGLHERALTQAIGELAGSINDQWRVISKTISTESRIESLIESLRNCKICAIDTSIYGKRESDSNPYIFFCLGLGHGLQKEMVPLTYKSHENAQLPFDIRGLWHIFYRDSDQLKSQFKGIMPHIDTSWRIEQDGYLHKKIWTPFLDDGYVHIMTCGRSYRGNRGIRTNIDIWDYKTVSKLTHFFALKFPRTRVEIAPPRSKLNNDELDPSGIEQIGNNIRTHLQDKDCIIIGSPDVSDLAEIVLSKLHNISPYEKDRKRFKGYVIIKKLEAKCDVTMSSVYWQKENNESEGIVRNNINTKPGPKNYFPNRIDEHGGEIYGVLTIANNPFVTNGKSRKIMILSGFSGPATFGIARLLTHEDFSNELSRLDTEYGARNIQRDQNVQILIRVTFSNGPEGKDDNREFTGVSLVDMIPI